MLKKFIRLVGGDPNRKEIDRLSRCDRHDQFDLKPNSQ